MERNIFIEIEYIKQIYSIFGALMKMPCVKNRTDNYIDNMINHQGILRQI